MKIFLSLCACLFLLSCVSVPKSRIGDEAIAPGVTLSLPGEAPFATDLNVTQIVQARYEDRQQLFQSFIQTDAVRLVLVMTVPSGPRIMRIDWGDGRIAARRESIAPAELRSERTMADLFLVYASHDAVERALHGARVVDGPGGRRSVRVSGHDVILIRRPEGDVWTGNATLSNLAYNYQLNIQSRRAGP